MRISTNTLIGLPVETESGVKLGKVHAVELDIEFSSIVHYVVRPVGIVEELIRRDEQLVAPTQVKSITDKKMVVEDMVGKEVEKMNAGSRMKSVLRPRSVVS